MIILDSEYKDSLHSKDNFECRRWLKTFIVGIIWKNGENNKIIIFWNRCLLKNHTTCMYCNFVFRSSLFVFFILITLTLSSLFYQSKTIRAILKLLREGCPLFKLDPLFLYYVY